MLIAFIVTSFFDFIFVQVEICRYGCPDHCQRPNSYTAREQEVSSSINVPQYQPGPRFEKHRNPEQHKIRQRQDTLNNEIPQVARLVAPETPVERLPTPQKQIQELKETPANIKETVRSVNNNNKVLMPAKQTFACNSL